MTYERIKAPIISGFMVEFQNANPVYETIDINGGYEEVVRQMADIEKVHGDRYSRFSFDHVYEGDQCTVYVVGIPR